MKAVFSHPILHVGVKIAGALLASLSVALFVLIWLTGQAPHKELYKLLGTLAEFSAIAGGGMWLVRHAFMQGKKRNIRWQHDLKEAFLFFRKHHTLFGYLALFLVISHGTYFFLHHDDKMGRVYSGIGAFVALLLVSTLGYVLQRFNKGKQGRSYKKLHQWAALLFGGALAVHLLM
ncbi:hypothetical protein GGR02_000470 [Anoxybacillus voinovskiensis]|uniref:Ferric oxidoreductase domain-containing protein n=1 Tax=Anoxybacteroides voinovskiense TaxID=230470 RepID=A0A840DI44_9BACL|nr:hypothetical protein [Anoxybacillus voinovskiensis]MBB4072724.1 hypothetical protein [Anoxybacillus voinovskiensis]GGJ60893.1 hypothetical protein GCM10008982_07490 [Anoxybacillus voinovskiensis]